MEQGASRDDPKKNLCVVDWIRDGQPPMGFLRSRFHPNYNTCSRNNMHHSYSALSGIDLRLVIPVLAYIHCALNAAKFPSNLLLPSKCPPRFFHFSLASLSRQSHSHIQCLRSNSLAAVQVAYNFLATVWWVCFCLHKTHLAADECTRIHFCCIGQSNGTMMLRNQDKTRCQRDV